MATFPVIKYASELPPAQGPNIRARLDTNTGAEQVAQAVGNQAATFRAAGNLAGAASSIGFELDNKIMLAEDAMALSTLERQNAEIRNAATQTMQATQDPEQQIAIGAKAKQEMGALGAGVRPRVARGYAQRNNQVIPAWDAHTNEMSRQTKINRLSAELKINDQADLETGSSESFAKRQHTAELVGLQTPEITAWKVANFGVQSQLVQANKLIDSNNPNAVKLAKERLETMDPSGLSALQADFRNKSIRLADQQLGYFSQKASGEIDEAEAKRAMDNLSPVDHQKQGEAILAKIRNDPLLSPVQREVQLRQHLAWDKRYAAEAEQIVRANEAQAQAWFHESLLTLTETPIDNPVIRKTTMDALRIKIKTVGLSAEDRLQANAVLSRLESGDMKNDEAKAESVIALKVLAGRKAVDDSWKASVIEEVMANPLLTPDKKNEWVGKVQAAQSLNPMAKPDYDSINSLRQRIDAEAQSGIVDTTLKEDIDAAYRGGSFGMSKTASVQYQSMLKDRKNRQFSGNLSATTEVRQRLESYLNEKKDWEQQNAAGMWGVPSPQGTRDTHASEKLSYFDQDMREWVEKNPNASRAQAYQHAAEASTIYADMNLSEMEKRSAQVKTGASLTLPVVQRGDDTAYGRLPSGTEFTDETGKRYRKP